MTLASLKLIPHDQRQLVFAEIAALVYETDAINRSLERMDESVSVDDALSEIIIKLNGALRRARKQLRLQEAQQESRKDAVDVADVA